ncbi:sigma factor-like helix-turn-helix DNA-binding protein, partial [Treponema sp. R6D11]
LTKPASEDSNYTPVDFPVPVSEIPENVFFAKEYKETMFSKLERELSKFEYKVLESFLEGNSYVEIAEQVGKTPKSIDNAIQRIRKKISKEEMMAS